MKHNKRFSNLSRTTQHRQALAKNVTKALLIYKKINTTKAKSEATIFLANKVIKKIKNLQTLRQKIITIKKYIENQNRNNINTILNTIDSLVVKTNYIQRTAIFNMRSDCANIVQLALI